VVFSAGRMSSIDDGLGYSINACAAAPKVFSAFWEPKSLA
jgi:hypothetical protein